jgi:transposase InsO family protein
MLSKPAIRFKWINLYQQLGHAGKVCQHYGISRFTLRKWLKRYEKEGKEGLLDCSSKPKISPLQKRNQAQEQIILNLRSERKLGARRLQSELKRLYDLSFSLSTIHKVLKKHNVPLLSFKRHYRKQIKRYSCKIPGERVQMDVCKIAHELYQYTAIDDCTRYKILALYSRRTSGNTLDFLDQLQTRMPFPCQKIQTDRGAEFFAYKVQERLKELKIKFRPIKPFSPHLNGKVERSQKTDLDEFYSGIELKDPRLLTKLRAWEEYYNKERSHSSLQGKTPCQRYQELKDIIPNLEEIHANYDISQEVFAIQNYKYDQMIKKINKKKIELLREKEKQIKIINNL